MLEDSERIVSLEVKPTGEVEVFKQLPDGTVTSEMDSHKFWLLSSADITGKAKRLSGNLHYKWGYGFSTKDEFSKFTNSNRHRDTYTIWNEKENYMVRNNLTYFGGMKQKEVSLLSFDLETTSLAHDRTAKILLISAYYRDVNGYENKLFSYDEYKSEGEMLLDFCKYVREKDPSLFIGHNIAMYDFPYMKFCADRAKIDLCLGRDGSPLTIDKRESKFRKDGSQFLHYHKSKVYGREIVDTMFLSIKYDIGRKYENFRLKSIIAHEKLEAEDRVFYDASTIKDNYKDPIEFAKIKQYCLFDAEDSVKLWDLMSPSFFYLSPHVPKPFQIIMESATGSQINSAAVAHYLSQLHSIPKANDSGEFQGATTLGVPGIHKWTLSADVASLYPSLMRQYKIFPKSKDPLNYFETTLEYFLDERLKNKKIAKETGDKYFDDLQSSQKIFANSLYGFMGAPGLNFNFPEGAAEVTRKGREVITKAVKWATSRDFEDIKKEVELKTGKGDKEE